jgi:DHA3 family macrolide efflux protein-like MFS transporter
VVDPDDRVGVRLGYIFMYVLPRVFVSPFAGALVDRWHRRIVMIVADVAIALATILFAVLF